MTEEDAVWVALMVMAAAYEFECIRRGAYDRTASRTTRRWFRTHHPAGAAVFATTWLGFSLWYTRHILKGPRSA